MSEYLYWKLSDQLVLEWISNEIRLDDETTPNNEKVFSAFATAAHQLSKMDGELEGETDLQIYNPKFVTKTTVKRIYRELVQLQENYTSALDRIDPEEVLETMSIPDEVEGHEIQEDLLLEALETQIESDVAEEFAESFYAIHSANRILPFLTISQVLIDEYSIELLNSELISSHYQDSNNTFKFLEKKLSQPTREQLLQRTGVLDGGIVGKMAEIRQTRNDLVHDLRSMSYFEEIVDSVDVADSVIKVIAEFEDRLNEQGFAWSKQD